MNANMHDVVRRLSPGHVVCWQSNNYSYVGYYAPNGMIYTTATAQNTYVPQVMTLTEFANLLDNEGASLFLATGWQVQDAAASSDPPPPPGLQHPV